MNTKDVFIRKAENKLVQQSAAWSNERVHKLVALSDAVIPLLEPIKYDIDVVDGRLVVFFVVDTMMICDKNRADFQSLLKCATSVSIRADGTNGEAMRVLLYFDAGEANE